MIIVITVIVVIIIIITMPVVCHQCWQSRAFVKKNRKILLSTKTSFPLSIHLYHHHHPHHHYHNDFHHHHHCHHHLWNMRMIR